MEGYRAVVRGRLRWNVALLVALAVIAVLASLPVMGLRIAFVEYTEAGGDLIHFQAFIGGVAAGLFAVFVVGTILDVVRSARSLGDEKRLRAQYIKEHDERAMAIQNQIGGKGYTVVLVVVALGVFVAAIFGQITVSATLLAVLCVMALVKAALRAYYQRKL